MFGNVSAIGTDIGRNSIRSAVVRVNGEIVAVKVSPLKKVQTRDYLVEKVVEAVRKIRQTAAGEGINPVCTGISAKGFVEHRSGVVLGPDQGIKDWKDVPLAAIVGRETGLPAYAGNDANMMTIAEHRFGSAKGYRNVIFVALRTGIGGGIIINGNLYRGVSNAGGEIGQMIIDYNSGFSDKGIRGSFEYLASAAAVVRRYREEAGISGKGGKELTCREVFELSRGKSEAAAAVVRENAMLVGVGLANIISIFAPEMIVVGGGMSEADDDWFNLVKQSAIANSLPNCNAEVRIERAMLGQAGALIGSAYYGMIRLAGQNF